MLWSERHAPKKLADIVGNKKAIEAILAWARAWKSGKPQTPLLLHGPPGTGKSAIPCVLASDFGWGFLEMNAGGLRNKAAISRITGQASQASTLSGSRRLILIDDVDSMHSSDRGGIPELARTIPKATQPLLFTASDLWIPKLAPLRKLCKGLAISPLGEKEIAAHLKKIAKKERAKFPEHLLSQIAASCKGDMRSAINDLQSHASGQSPPFTPRHRNSEVDVRQALAQLFASASFQDARQSVFDVDVDHDMLLKWIDENLPAQCSTRLALAKAFDVLSRASLFDGRVRRRQYYALWRYSSALMTGGVVTAGAHSTSKDPKFSFPRQILLLSRQKATKAQLRAALTKLASACHVSTRRAKNYLPLVAALSKEKASRAVLKEAVGFTDEELALVSSLFR